MTVVDENQPVGEGQGCFQRVLYDDDRMAILYVQVVNEFVKITGPFWIEGRCRFVKDEDFRTGRQDTGNDQPLPLAAR